MISGGGGSGKVLGNRLVDVVVVAEVVAFGGQLVRSASWWLWWIVAVVLGDRFVPLCGRSVMGQIWSSGQTRSILGSKLVNASVEADLRVVHKTGVSGRTHGRLSSSQDSLLAFKVAFRCLNPVWSLHSSCIHARTPCKCLLQSYALDNLSPHTQHRFRCGFSGCDNNGGRGRGSFRGGRGRGRNMVQGNKDKSELKCYECGKFGHFAYECSNRKDKEKEKEQEAHLVLEEEEEPMLLQVEDQV